MRKATERLCQLAKRRSCHYTVSELPKFVKNRASSQSHPVAEGGLPAVQQHLYAGYHHLLLPVCKTTCYQKVPLWSKDITSKYIFTSKERRKQITQRLLVSAICFLNHYKLQV